MTTALESIPPVDRKGSTLLKTSCGMELDQYEKVWRDIFIKTSGPLQLQISGVLLNT